MSKKVIFIIVALITLALPFSASAHFLGQSSVDGREIKWEESTKYDGARNHAQDQWNALGRVNIAPDDALSYTDLDWGDVNYCSVTWDGQWVPRTAEDAIQLNTCYLDRQDYGDFQDQAVATHELGHALGLAHSFVPQIMNDCSICSGVNTPQNHDREDYFALYP